MAIKMSGKTFFCPCALLAEGWRANCLIRIDDQAMITEISSGEPDDDAIRLPGPVMPGMVNVHSHIHQRLIAGLTCHRQSGRDSFWTWRERMYRAVGMLDGEELQKLASWAFMELLEGGYTATGEFHYPHRTGGSEPHETASRIIAAADSAGMTLTLLPVWYRYAGFGRQPVSEQQAPFVMELSEMDELIGQLRQQTNGTPHQVGVAPHSLRAVDVADLPELLDRITAGPVHMHISEQHAEIDECRRHCGTTPIDLLAREIELDDRWCLIHATHATVPEIGRMAESDAVIGLCPTTEADLGDGLFPVRSFADLGGSFAVGSDSNLVMSAAVELRQLEWGERLSRHERNVLCADGGHTGRWLWQRTAEAGARALDQPVGALKTGQRADFIVLDTAHPLLHGLDPEYQLDTFVLAGAGGMIKQVYTGGCKVVEDGIHPARAALAPEIVRLRTKLSEAS